MMYSEEQLKENINGFERQMLYEIRNLLLEIKSALCKSTVPQQATLDEKSIDIEQPKSKQYACSYCNTPYENVGKRLACERKHKKEGG